MKKIVIFAAVVFICLTGIGQAGFLDNLFKSIGPVTQKAPTNSEIISGLKEALSVGTEKAVKEVSQIDGYLGNEAIKIIIPKKIQNVADVLSKVGFQRQVDDFVTSMNRAAEKAAVKAAPHFVYAIREMSFDDAKKILKGSDSAATDYFRTKTSDKLYADFKPVISSAMNQVGATANYKKMMDSYTALPFMKDVAIDLDDYVTNNALDGLFYMIAEEEKKIRTDPAARVTDLLKKVFSN